MARNSVLDIKKELSQKTRQWNSKAQRICWTELRIKRAAVSKKNISRVTKLSECIGNSLSWALKEELFQKTH